MSSKQAGFTLIEAVVAMTIFAIGVVGLVTLSTVAKSTSEQGRDSVQVSNYLQEGMEAVRLLRNAAWTNVSTDGGYRLSAQAGQTPAWQLVSGGSETVGKYQRSVTISAVRRQDTDSSATLTAGDKIVPSGGSFDDPDTKKITVTISWQQGSRTINRTLYAYITKWQS